MSVDEFCRNDAAEARPPSARCSLPQGQMSDQVELFPSGQLAHTPEGFRYRSELLSEPEEERLIHFIPSLPLERFRFHGYEGKRRTYAFGFGYDFDHERLVEAAPIPAELLSVRRKVADFAAVPEDDFNPGDRVWASTRQVPSKRCARANSSRE